MTTDQMTLPGLPSSSPDVPAASPILEVPFPYPLLSVPAAQIVFRHLSDALNVHSPSYSQHDVYMRAHGVVFYLFFLISESACDYPELSALADSLSDFLGRGANRG